MDTFAVVVAACCVSVGMIVTWAATLYGIVYCYRSLMRRVKL